MAPPEIGGYDTNPTPGEPRMAKSKRKSTRRQPHHGAKSTPSNHDKRTRLGRRSATRERTSKAKVPLIGVVATLAVAMSKMLDPRIAFRLPIIMAGAMLASGRRTAANWLRCAGVQADWDRFYDLLQTIGKKTTSLSLPLLSFILKKFDPGEGGCWTLVIDDSPTKRFGPHVEAANLHHNPTPGPGDSKWVYGHSWVCVALSMTHAIFGVIGLPLLSSLYVRKADIGGLQPHYPAEFRTKHDLALELCQHVMQTLRALGSKAGFLVVFDGAYAAKKLVRSLHAAGATIISRLRRNAILFDLPIKTAGKRGRPRIYGENRIDLRQLASDNQGWERIDYACRGIIVQAQYKTFLATCKITGGPVRVVILKYTNDNWAAFFSTNTAMDVAAILKTVSDRWSIEEFFHDTKEIWGAGQQQVRNIWSNIGCWNLCGWLYTIVELACWDDTSEQLVDRSDRPWDNPDRRPSHADRRRRIAREMLQNVFFDDLQIATERGIIRQRLQQILAYAA